LVFCELCLVLQLAGVYVSSFFGSELVQSVLCLISVGVPFLPEVFACQRVQVSLLSPGRGVLCLRIVGLF